MVKKLKTFTLNVVAGANIATIAMMLLSGFSDRVSPEKLSWMPVAGMLFPVFLLLNLAFLVFWILVKWRRAWIPVVGYALAYVPITIYLPLHPPATHPEKTLKIISYNVCAYGGNYKYKDAFERIISYLDAEQPDIVCFQEDIDTWRRYVFQTFEKSYPYNDTLHFTKRPSLLNGVGIHSKFPILRRERIVYPSKNNGSVAYYLLVEGDTVLVVNNHLESTHLNNKDRQLYETMIKGKMERDTMKNESLILAGKLKSASVTRARGAEAVHSYIAAHSQYPTIVLGDFNDPPISYTHHIIGKGLTDCFSASGRGIGLSYNRKGYFFRIDHIFCSSHFEPVDCKVDSKIDYSDHYPLLCWLKFKDNY